MENAYRVTEKYEFVQDIPFGTHKDKPFNEIPRDYLEWLSGTELDEDMAFTVRHHLGLL